MWAGADLELRGRRKRSIKLRIRWLDSLQAPHCGDHADHENGYIADVKYEGHPVHPPHGGPKYHPAPKPYAPHPHA